MSAPEHTRPPALVSCFDAQWRTHRQAPTLITPSKPADPPRRKKSSHPPNRSSWISWFLSSKGNEYFCEVEEDYILDRFNLTGLNTEVQNYTQALDLITDNLGPYPDPGPAPSNHLKPNTDDDFQEELRGSLDIQARLLYGLIHARWIVTARGLAKMVRSTLSLPCNSHALQNS